MPTKTSLLAGLLAAGFFLASPYIFHTTALARVNSLALLFAVAAVSLVQTPTRWRIGLGILALLASLFTKPTAVDAAAACIGFLLLVRPRMALLALGALLGLGAMGLGSLVWATRGAFWLNVVAGNANPFDLAELGKYVVNFAAIHAVILVLAAAEVIHAVQRRAWSPWVLYFPFAALMGLTVGKWGAGESYLLPLIAATSVLAGARLARMLNPEDERYPPPQPFDRLREGSSPVRGAGARILPNRRSWVGAALAAQMLLFAHGPISEMIPWLPDLGRQAEFLGRVPSAADRANAEALVDLMRRGDGNVLSEAPSFAIEAGKNVVANATHLRNLYEAGLWNPNALVADVRGHRFAVIVLNAQLYPAPVLAAIGRSYYLADEISVGPSTYQIFLPGGD